MITAENKEMENKQTAEFKLGDIGPIVLVLVIAGVTAALGLNVMSDVKADFTTDSAEFNATADGITGISKITSKFGIIGTAVAFVIILGVIGGLFAVSKMGR